MISQDESIDVAQMYPKEMSIDPDTDNLTIEDIRKQALEGVRKFALENINFVYEKEKKANILVILDVVLDKVFGYEEISGVSSISEDERITIIEPSMSKDERKVITESCLSEGKGIAISRSSLYNYFIDIKEILTTLLLHRVKVSRSLS